MRLAIIVTALVSVALAPVVLAQVPAFTIRGTLVTPDGDPVADVTVFVHKGDRVAIEIGADGRLANPTGKTDSSGRFLIEVARSFLPSTRKITLSAGAGPQRELAHLRESKTNTPLSFEIDAKLRVLDLDRLVGKIVVPLGN
jgi:hypothetical protein